MPEVNERMNELIAASREKLLCTTPPPAPTVTGPHPGPWGESGSGPEVPERLTHGLLFLLLP